MKYFAFLLIPFVSIAATVSVSTTPTGPTYDGVVSEPYPSPDTTVPMVDSNGVQVGTARLLVDADTLLPVAVINSASPQRAWTNQQEQFVERLNDLVRESDAIKRASQVVVRKTVTNDVQLLELEYIFPDWQSGVAVKVGDLYRFRENLYRVVQAHTTAANWTPDTVPALFTKIAAPGTVVAWKQPTGAQDAYQIGDKVTHNGFTWQSTAANNVWAPGVFGWTQL